MGERHKKFFETDIWRDSHELQKEIFQLTHNFSKREVYSLVDQINRSSNSVCANVAESHGRYHYLDKIRTLYIARGEIEETQSHIIVASSRGYITKEVSASLLNRYEVVKRKLNKYINTLYSQK